MALTPTNVTRTDDTTGDLFLTFDTPGGDKAQGMALVDANGAPIGFTGSPAVVSVTGNVTIDSTTPVNVSVTNTDPIPVFTSIPAGSAPFRYDTGGTAEASAVMQANSCLLRQLRVILDPSVVNSRYLMLFDATSLPANGTAPDWRGLIPPSGEMSESWDLDGLPFGTNGLVAAISTSADTLTISGNEAFFHARGWT